MALSPQLDLFNLFNVFARDRWLRSFLLSFVVLFPIPLLAQQDPETPSTHTSSEMIAPEPISPITVPYPSEAPRHKDPILVRATITIDLHGRVLEVKLETPPQPPFDQALQTALTQARFTPAMLDGQAVTVQLTFEQTFDPPPLRSKLSGWLKEKGTRQMLAGITVVISPKEGGEAFVCSSDERGYFETELPEGLYRVIIQSNTHKAFKQTERLSADQALTVAYLLERIRYDDDEIVVIGTRDRAQVASTTLTGRELRQVPGTFGDPFRVVQALPGVTTPISILPLPVVRGSSPSSTGFMLDQTRLPLLFHLLGGPSVIHPEMIEEIQFFPGGAPVAYGGYTGGIIDGLTRPARKDEKVLDLDLNLTQTGLFLRTPIPSTQLRMSAGGRIGYPGVLLSLLSDEISLSYWDYQARIDSGTAGTGWSLMGFGAQDLILTRPADGGALAPTLRYEFHRVDLSGRYTQGAWGGRAQVAVGLDETQLSESSPALSQLHLTPRLEGVWNPNARLSARLGLNGSFRRSELGTVNEGADPGGPVQAVADEGVATPPSDSFIAGSYAECLVGISQGFYLTPGVRFDYWHDESATRYTFDPRLHARFLTWGQDTRSTKSNEEESKESQQVQEVEDQQEDDSRSLWLKASLGRYHQPPRFLVPIPGLDQLPLSYGMLASTQGALGFELRLLDGISLDVQAYYSDMDPVIFDLSINQNSLQDLPTNLPGQVEENGTAQDIADRLLTPQQGRAYGTEMMLRKRSRTGIYGWFAYTLSRSERKREGEWVPFDFDRTHILNAVLGIPLGSGWEIGGRFQFQSGSPVTTTYGYNEGRKQPFIRLDMRIDKRAVWRSWLLDYYIDIQNLLLSAEEVAPGQRLRFVLPTIGFRGRL